MDPAGRLRVGELTTLGDYKQTGFQRTLLLNTAGTGTAAWSASKLALSVAGNQYMVMQSNRVHPYFSGKPQLIEITNDRMQHEDGITKRWGYFSSSVVAPYTANLDGFWLETDGDDFYIVSSRNGTETARVASQAWDNWVYINRYNWQFFSVIFFDFLWLGGAVLRMWVKTELGFVLAHTINYAGTSEDVIILNPSQPLRVEIRGSAGASGGQLRYVCAQVATEGAIDEAGQVFAVNTGTPEIALAAVDTTYPVIAVRKKAARVEAPVDILNVDAGIGSANDRGVWSLQINPTLSAGLTYADVTNFSIQKANGNGVITVTSPGTIIASGPLATGITIPPGAFEQNFLTRLSQTIAGSMDEYVLCIGTQTGGINATGYITLKEN